LSNEIKRLIGKYAKQTGGSVHPFHLNDFGDRGVSSPESAALGGAAHLVNFQGTDTLQAIQMLRALYNGGKDTGHSVMASEHSTTTIYGKDAEEDAYRHFLQVAEPNSILSVVIDSWDTLNAVNYILGEKLKKEILERPGRLVLRPDSGTPEEMAVQVTDLAFNRFGGTTNAAGYKELNPKIGVIYGDGITYRSIGMILENMVKHKYAVSNLVFGMGGGLLQQVNRDTQKFAFKCSWAKVADEGREVFKQPKTDSGKNSKKGRLKLCQTNFGQLATFQEDFQADTLQSENLLVPVFENGELLVDQSLNDIRQRAAQ
jgi:nicotinamide phosphoribosyltransferase